MGNLLEAPAGPSGLLGYETINQSINQSQDVRDLLRTLLRPLRDRTKRTRLQLAQLRHFARNSYIRVINAPGLIGGPFLIRRRKYFCDRAFSLLL